MAEWTFLHDIVSTAWLETTVRVCRIANILGALASCTGSRVWFRCSVSQQEKRVAILAQHSKDQHLGSLTLRLPTDRQTRLVMTDSQTSDRACGWAHLVGTACIRTPLDVAYIHDTAYVADAAGRYDELYMYMYVRRICISVYYAAVTWLGTL